MREDTQLYRIRARKSRIRQRLHKYRDAGGTCRSERSNTFELVAGMMLLCFAAWRHFSSPRSTARNHN